MMGHAEKARKYMIEADNSNNSREKVLHYVNAAKEYARAVDTVTDPVVKASLAYLSVSATQKAQLVQSIIQQYSTDNVLQLEQANKAMGKAKPFGPISDVSDNVHDNRLIFKGHQSRLAGINKIPKFTAPSDATVVKDLLTLEARLNDLGLRRNGADSSSPVPHRNIKISSDLGESFMVLKPGGPAVLSASVASVSASEAPTPVLERRPSLNSNTSDDSTSGYGGGNKIKNLVTSPHSSGSIGSTSSSGSAASSLAAPLAWATNVMNMNWTGFTGAAAAAAPGDNNSTGISMGINRDSTGNWVEDDFDEGGEGGALNWNEQSMFNAGAVNPSSDPYGSPAMPVNKASNVYTTVATGKKIVSAPVASKQQPQQQSQPQEQRHYHDVMAQSHATVMNASIASSVSSFTQHQHHTGATHASSEDSLTRSTLNTIASAAKDNSEGVLNLLNSIKRLGEENAALVAKIEQLTKVEDENKKIITDMELFRMDYEDKFKRVKKVLKEYAAKFPHGSNPVSEAFDAVAQQQADEKEAAKALAGMATGEVIQEKTESKSGVVGSAEDPAAVQAAGDGKRLKDLERTVNALVGRLQHANDEIKRRDGMLTRYDPQYVSTILPPTKHASRPPSGGIPQSSSSSSSAAAGGSRASVGSGVGVRAGLAAGTLSPVPPKKQITAPVARHSGAATLESLQQKNKNAF